MESELFEKYLPRDPPRLSTPMSVMIFR